MEKDDIKIVQQIAKEILFDIIDICERNDIEYFLMFGSLLGAVRHKGMIPWDDDIDIGMTRKNYMKFLSVSEEQLSKENELILMGSADTISEMKIGRKGTVYCLREAKDLHIASEISVDIFLVDFIKIKPTWKEKIDYKVVQWLRICGLNWDEKKLLFISIDKSSHYFKFAYKLGLVGMHGIRVLLKEDGINQLVYNIKVDKTEKSGRIGCAYARYTLPEYYNIIKLPFENRMLSAMDIYDKMLKNEYGDYMTLPPEEKRYNKHIEDWILEVKQNM